MKAKVFFCVLTRDTSGGERVRTFLDFEFGDDVTANDVIEGVSGEVKGKGGKPAVSRRSSCLMVFDPSDKSLLEVERSCRLGDHPTVQRSVKLRGSVGFLIDDVRPERQFFRSDESAQVAEERGLTPPSAASAFATAPPTSSSMRQRAPRYYAEDVEAVVADMLADEINELRMCRAQSEYPRWSELLDEPPSVAKWKACLNHEKAMMSAHRTGLLRENANVDHEVAGLRAEIARLSRDINEMDAAVLKCGPEFDMRNALQRRLNDERHEVDRLSTVEAGLMAQIDDFFNKRTEALKAAPPQPTVAAATAPAVAVSSPDRSPLSSIRPVNATATAEGALWPAFESATRERTTTTTTSLFGPDEQARTIAAMWGLHDDDLGPIEPVSGQQPPVAASASRTLFVSSSKPSPNGGNRLDGTSSSPSVLLHGSPSRVDALSEPHRVAAAESSSALHQHLSSYSSPAAASSSLEAGLGMLDPALNAQVRQILQLDSATRSTSTASKTTDHEYATGSQSKRAPHVLSSTVPLRLLASDLGQFLSTDGSDAETRRQLLLRVQELRDKIVSRRE